MVQSYFQGHITAWWCMACNLLAFVFMQQLRNVAKNFCYVKYMKCQMADYHNDANVQVKILVLLADLMI